MILARMIGNVVSTEKHREYLGYTILIVQPLNRAGKAQGQILPRARRRSGRGGRHGARGR